MPDNEMAITEPPFKGMKLMPYGLPLMLDAWIGCVMWASGQELIVAEFCKETGFNANFFIHRSALDAAIDKATGKTTPNHFAEQEGVASQLDELHLRKIDMADEIFIVNPPTTGHRDGYIGERTRADIEYAKSLGKPINYLTTCQTTRWPLPNLPSKE